MESSRAAKGSQISIAAEMALERKDSKWLDRYISGLRRFGLEDEAREVEKRRRDAKA